MVATGLKKEAREWEVGLPTGHEGRGWTGRERPDVKGPEGCLSMESGDCLPCLFTHWLVPSSQLCFFITSSCQAFLWCLSPAVGKGRLCYVLCFPCQTAWCFLGYSPSYPPHLVSRSCPFSLPNLPEASYTFKTWKNKPQLPALSSHHSLPLRFTNKHLEWVMDTTLSFPTHCN